MNQSKNEKQQHNDSNEKEALSLDNYTQTGIYIEEDKKNGDLLIVFGKDVLDSHLRQFYLSEENKVFTRVHSENQWSSWFIIKPEDLKTERLDFNDYNEANLFITSDIDVVANSPEEFSPELARENNMLICISVTETHLLQFLIAENRKNFWVRHYSEGDWNNWHKFL